MPERYKGKPITVTIDAPSTVELPPQIFLGRLVGMLFDPDKTFLLSGAMRGIGELKRFYDQHPGLHVLVVGHTDTTGETGYNVTLSKERAEVVAAYLKDDVDTWLKSWRAGRPAGTRWGAVEDQHMLAILAGYEGNLDGKIGPRSREAVKRFQGGAGLPETGSIDDATRKQLVTRYLDQDQTTLPKGTPLVVHGAGPHHPVPDDPGEEVDPAEKRRRNRRVEIFLSDGPIEPAPGAPAGPEYDQWVKKARETVDFAEANEDLVELDIEWPADVVDRLPDDFKLVLSGPNLPAQERDKSAGVQLAEGVRFAFQFIDKANVVDLVASGGGKKVKLWSQQVAGDLAAKVDWNEDIDVLLGEPEEVEAECGSTDAGKMRDDPRAEDLRALIKGLL